MNVAIVGSRTFKDYAFLCTKMDEVWSLLGPFGVVSGGADGADSLGVRWANARKVIPEVFPAFFYDLSHADVVIKTDRKGRQYDALAGMRRNQQIVDRADVVIAFWDSRSPGTKDTIDKAKKANKPVSIYWPG